MATFTAGTSFTDGVTGDVTAAKLNALVANATPLSNLITDRTAETSIATDDLVLISDTSESGALNKMTVANLMKAEMTGTINSTAGTITTGVIPTLTSTTLITSGTGTAAAPAIVPTGDTNTGIFFPAADTIAFSEGGTEAMRIDSSGRVGIGTTSPQSIFNILKTSAGNTTIGLALKNNSLSTNTAVGIEFNPNQSDEGAERSAKIVAINTGNGANNPTALTFWTNEAGTNSTERLRIDSSGRVGIGTTSPSSSLHVQGLGGSIKITDLTGATNTWEILAKDASTNAFRIYDTTANTERLRIDSSGNVGIGITDPSNYNPNANNLVVGDTTSANGITITSGTASSGGLFFADEKVTGFSGYLQYDHSSDYIRIGTNAIERLRITSGGEVYIAGTTDQGAYNLQVNGTGVWGAGAYVNGSDERLKENIQDITSGLDVVEKLRPVSFQYKEEYTADRSIQSGFIAQDLLVALEGKNYLEGIVSQGPTYYNVAYQNLIPILAKAIQELKTISNSQAQTITSLESRITALEAA